ncbi:MAG TPA: BamA/TamA family outer membrane protein [Bordetella sp.]
MACAKAPLVEVDAGDAQPGAVQGIVEAVTRAVGAIARLADDQDADESARLQRRADEAARSALATQGYFTPRVTLSPGQDAQGGPVWRIAVAPGVRAEVESVDLRFAGRVTRPEYADRIAAWRRDWALPAGRPFVNADWSKAKSDLLRAVSGQDFPTARITSSSADVDPQSARVRLVVAIDSGPRVRLGALQVDGLRRVPRKLVEGTVRYAPGEAYEQDKLDHWQQALQSTAFFRGAFVSLDTSKLPPAPDDDGDFTLPVTVRVTEAAPRRAAVSVGVDDASGARLESTYRQNVVFGQPVTLSAGFGVDRLRQRAYMDFLLPPDADGDKDSIGVLADRSDVQGLQVTRFALGATRLQERHACCGGRAEYETRWGALLAHDHVKIDGGETYDLPTATVTVEWLRRDVDKKYDPREGNLIALGGGVGMALDTGRPYTRAHLRAQKWWPVAKLDSLTLRGEVGRVWADARTTVPDDFGFRTGGARTVRGYSYLSLGEKRDNAVVGAPALAVASIEYDHYFNYRWGMGVFVDAGDAAASFSSLHPAVGYGVGARVRTPAGPLFLDVAYGQRDHQLRLHFSLGIAF